MTAAPARPAPPRRVLLVDDDPFMRRVLGDALEEKGFEVVQAQSGREAMRVIIEGNARPRLVVTDLVMPDTDGRALLGLLRVADQTPRIPIVVVTGQAGMERELEGEGAEAVLEKSLGLAVITEAVEALFTMAVRDAGPGEEEPARDADEPLTTPGTCAEGCLHAAYCKGPSASGSGAAGNSDAQVMVLA